MSVHDSHGQCRPSLHLWIKHDPCMQIHGISSVAERLFSKKGGPLRIKQPIVGSGVLSALQNSWKATSLEICWLFYVAFCGRLHCCATHTFIWTPEQHGHRATINVLYYSGLKSSCGLLKADLSQKLVPSGVIIWFWKKESNRNLKIWALGETRCQRKYNQCQA